MSSTANQYNVENMEKIFYRKIPSDIPVDTRNAIKKGFLTHYQRSDIRKTHLFGGRYENIYLNHNHIPQLRALMADATAKAEKLLHKEGIRAGYWFNYMPPGSVTLAHRHDDDDELLSGVYYVDIPENSGNLILHEKVRHSENKNKPESIEISPEEGIFIFFQPDIMHEVTINRSPESRLSIGMNFGIPSTED